MVRVNELVFGSSVYVTRPPQEFKGFYVSDAGWSKAAD